MTDRKALPEQTETPEDVATLYSWANLHGAKYRDFSASRAQTREKARQRVQQAIEEERRRAWEEAEARKVAEATQQTIAAHVAVQGAVHATAGIRSAELTELVAPRAVQSFGQSFSSQQSFSQAPSVVLQNLPQAWRQPLPDRFATLPASSSTPDPLSNSIPIPSPGPISSFTPNAGAEQVPTSDFVSPAASAYPPETEVPASASAYAPTPAYRAVPVFVQPVAPEPDYPHYAQGQEDIYVQPGNGWNPTEQREAGGRPAWLDSERVDRASQQPLPQGTADTLQGSRDRLASRWFALKSVFESDRVGAPTETVSAPIAAPVPTVAVFSLAGGVGKTSLVATLGRALSARGERVLLVDTAAFGLLPFFFGARDQRPGQLRTFSPPAASGDAPIQMVAVDSEGLGSESAPQEALAQEILRCARGTNRVLVDLATASGATTRRILRLTPTVLVPVVPDMSSVVSVSSIDAFFQRNAGIAGKQVQPFYVLNQFDPSLPLHLDVREVLREQLGDRLLPFALRRTPAVSEALAEGMTVMDYAPNSTAAEDFASLAGWVKSLAAPASTGYRGVRWSER